MQAGLLTDRITLSRAETVRADNGEPIQAFVDYACVRARVIAQRMSRALSNGEVWYPTARAFRIRKNERVQPGDRVTHDNVVYDVVNVLNDREDNSTTLNCDSVNT